jgi:uncharacterized repeat protein (TIGR01451 family)
MITIDPTTGIINANFLRQPAVDQLGALFFDVFGNLYGYGSYQSLVQDKFVSIDKITGAITLLGQGPTSTGQDGCACPYSIQLQKEVQPDTATVCTYVNYTFTFYNGSGITNQDVLFSDTLPQGLIWDKIVTLPYKGRVRISERELQISEMEISPGIDSIVARAISLPGTVGKFLNQAALRKLPETLGGQITSDNPDTPEGGDSTPLWVVPLPDSLFANRYQLCVGDSLLVNPTLYGAQYQWDNGSTDRQRWVKAPDSVSFSVYTECVEKTYSFLVSDDLVWVDIPEDSLTVSLGQWLSISNIVYSSSGDVSFEWTTDIQAQLDCASCQKAKVYALQDGYVYIYMYDDNGCIAADSVYVRVVKDRSVYFPNIISPSSLSGNNQFFLSGTETGVRNYHLKMYDRWGNLVFDVHDLLLGEKDRGWNGMAHGKHVEEGVYAWIATIYYIDGYTKEVSGDVTVLH